MSIWKNAKADWSTWGCLLVQIAFLCGCVFTYAARQADEHVCTFTLLCLMGLRDEVLNMNTSIDCNPFLITALVC